MSEQPVLNHFERLRHARVWLGLQFFLTAALIFAALAWTRLPDKSLWQVALTLLVPVLLIICVLELEAGTMRKLADDDGRRVSLIIGAVSMLLWIAIWAAAWAFFDWCDDRIPLWAGYLNSKASAHQRATNFTYEHFVHWLTVLEWMLRWIALPAKLLPFAASSAQWGWRLPWRRLYRFLWNGRWWLGVTAAAIVGAWLPGHFFDKPPSGTVSAQVWTIGFKLTGAYLLSIACWVLLLAWWAALFAESTPPYERELAAVPAHSGPPEGHRSVRLEPPPPDFDPEP